MWPAPLMLEEECPTVGVVEEVCPVGEVGFLLFVSVQRAGCSVYCHCLFLSVLIVSVSIWVGAQES